MIGQHPAIVRVPQEIDQPIAKKIGPGQLQFIDQRRHQVRYRRVRRNLHRLWLGQSAFFYINFEHTRAPSVGFSYR